ncbi:hypothetical protein CBW54_09625 [Yersinia kristensenii]|nr:hypothetical protein CBW54_09625 [Yersinia kristensenii]
MSEMAFWRESSVFNGWQKAHLVEGEYRSSASAGSMTFAELRDLGWELLTVEEARTRFSQANCLPVSEITAERFNDMLEVLPPLDWHFNEAGGAQSFKMVEMYCGNITDIFAQYGERYFTLRDCVTLPHGDILRKIKAFTDAEGMAE